MSLSFCSFDRLVERKGVQTLEGLPSQVECVEYETRVWTDG